MKNFYRNCGVKSRLSCVILHGQTVCAMEGQKTEVCVRVITHKCCATFAKATEDGTDSEGWQALLYIDEEEGISMGCELPRINFCPWCGVKVEHSWVEDGLSP